MISSPLSAKTTPDSASVYVEFAFRHLLQRKPRPDELQTWVSLMKNGLSEGDLFRRFVGSKEFQARSAVVPGHAPGHFYSPIVDPADIVNYWERSSKLNVADIHGINIDLSSMNAMWSKHSAFVEALNFSSDHGGATRYYISDRRYPHGDALVLGMMIDSLRPQRIIEIGSGFSSAAMLDIVDKLDLPAFHLTCIDPYADRVKSVLRPDDWSKITLLENKVQDVDLALFDGLKRNDILFIDSSHVLKTGSDVHFELFDILPRLKPGVVIHFHDIQFPFEYPKEWIFHLKWSWNEIYALRLFLMHNKSFDVIFFTDLFLKQAEMKKAMAVSITDPRNLVGGSLWIRRNDS